MRLASWRPKLRGNIVTPIPDSATTQRLSIATPPHGGANVLRHRTSLGQQHSPENSNFTNPWQHITIFILHHPELGLDRYNVR